MFAALSRLSLYTGQRPTSAVRQNSRVLGILQPRSARTLTIPWDGSDEFFKFKRGGFLWDEKRKIKERSVKFDVDELARRAAKAASIHTPLRCVKVEKRRDGLNSKILSFTMHDGTQIAGKVLYPCAGRPREATASEAATMEFVRRYLGTPVPKVLAYNTDANHPVGAEYILMENINGQPLSNFYGPLNENEKFKIARKLMLFGINWQKAPLSMFGGLYFRKDVGDTAPGVDLSTYETDDNDFSMGPSTSRRNDAFGKINAEFDRGPWPSALEYEKAVARRELACIEQLPLQNGHNGLYYPLTYEFNKERKLHAAKCYLKIADSGAVLPKDEHLCSPLIWHEKLHPDHILVDPHNPTNIIGIMDWRYTEIAPVYRRTIEPALIGAKDVKYKHIYDQTPLRKAKRDHEKAIKYRKDTRASRQFLIKVGVLIGLRKWLREHTPVLWDAMLFQEKDPFDFLRLGENLYTDAEPWFHSALLVDHKRRPHRTVLPNPITSEPEFKITSELKRQIKDGLRRVAAAYTAMHHIKTAVGKTYFENDGFVERVKEEEAKDTLERERQKFLNGYGTSIAKSKLPIAEMRAAWPFYA